MARVLVQSHAPHQGEEGGAFPFSWRIRDFVEELWVQARYISAAAGAPGWWATGEPAPSWTARAGARGRPRAQEHGASIGRPSGFLLHPLRQAVPSSAT